MNPDAALDRAAARDLRELVAQAGGTIPFEQFMREALYHPAWGYYARRVATVGAGGDFSTSATLHPALGEALAGWVRRHRAEVVGGSRWHLIELGGGTGQLAAGILAALGFRARWSVRYHIVEHSEILRAEQRRRLARRRNVRWHEDIADALREADGRALIVSNEFVDAFPCVVLEWERATGRWWEIGVRLREDGAGFAETLLPWQPPTVDQPGSSVAFGPETGALHPVTRQRFEWHRAYFQWLQGWRPLWQAGQMLTIDYGDTFPSLYYRRPGGTLRAYHQHERLAGPEVFARPGRQDLTADVNFSDLQRWAQPLGLDNVGLHTQADFLRAELPAHRLRRHERDPAFTFLTHTEGAGTAFKALEQRPTSAQNAA